MESKEVSHGQQQEQQPETCDNGSNATFSPWHQVNPKDSDAILGKGGSLNLLRLNVPRHNKKQWEIVLEMYLHSEKYTYDPYKSGYKNGINANIG